MFERYMHSKSSDIFQLGVCIYQLLFGDNPSYFVDGVCYSFSSWGTNESLDRERLVHYSSQNLNFPVFASGARISDTGKDLLKRMLDQDPERRPTCNKVLQHDWITDFASLSDEDFGVQYRNAIKGSKLRRGLHESIKQSMKFYNGLKSKIVDLLQPANAKLEISTVKFRELQSQFVEAVQGGGSGAEGRTSLTAEIPFNVYEKILIRNNLECLATQEIFKVFDRDGDHTLDYFEFLSVLSSMRETALDDDETEQCRHYFQMFDINGDGAISRDEFHDAATQMLIEHDDEVTQQSVDEMFRHIDESGDGSIQLNEFEQWFSVVINSSTFTSGSGGKQSGKECGNKFANCCQQDITTNSNTMIGSTERGASSGNCGGGCVIV